MKNAARIEILDCRDWDAYGSVHLLSANNFSTYIRRQEYI
jgi:hypothetical protein